MKKFKDVEAYITAAPAEAQAKLRELRENLRTILPQAEEKIWYGVPFYHQQGELIGFAAYARHISVGLGAPFFPETERAKLESMGYRTGLGTFQIRFDQKIPLAHLKKLLHAKQRSRNKTWPTPTIPAVPSSSSRAQNPPR